MSRLKGLSFRFFITTFSALTLMFGASLYSYLESYNSQKRAIEQDWLRNTDSISDSMGAQFFERYGDVQAFTKNLAFHNKDKEQMVKALNAYTVLYGLYDVILFVDLNGDLIATNTVSPDNVALDTGVLYQDNYKNSVWFQSAVEGKFTEDPAKNLIGTYFEDVMIDPIRSKVFRAPSVGVSFSAPVMDDKGKMIGVISNRSNMKWIEEGILNVYDKMKMRNLPSAEITLLNKQGQIIVDYDPSFQNNNDKPIYNTEKTILQVNLIEAKQKAAVLVSQGEKGTIMTKHIRKGIEQFTAFSSIKDPKWVDSIGWTVLVRINEQKLFAEMELARTHYFIIGALVFFACLASSALISRQLAKNLSQISSRIATSGSQVSSASHQLSSASGELSSGATEVASSIEETVSSLEELTSMVRANADNAAESASLAQSSTRTAREGETEISSLIEAIREISKSSKKMEEIINVIDDIAFQTNLLALNAAVEAARAGDQGRGFAVVAEAVRNLAQRSGTAAKEIATLIGDNVERIEHGTKLADRSGQVLQNILASAQKVSDLNNEIAAASKEQASGLAQISKAMNEIDHATQRNAAASEQVAASSDQMNHQSHDLDILVVTLNTIIAGKEEQTSLPAAEKKAEDLHQPQLRANRAMPSAKTASVLPLNKTRKGKDKSKSHAESVIPFDDESNDDPPSRIGSTAGF